MMKKMKTLMAKKTMMKKADISGVKRKRNGNGIIKKTRKRLREENIRTILKT